ncbi:hypothetical protein BT69DRAFT_1116911 [Atractiella rhizophila]|nr:hypothetical protein BT69DRAFT_1116911 [Atractiella rhizophila]
MERAILGSCFVNISNAGGTISALLPARKRRSSSAASTSSNPSRPRKKATGRSFASAHPSCTAPVIPSHPIVQLPPSSNPLSTPGSPSVVPVPVHRNGAMATFSPTSECKVWKSVLTTSFTPSFVFLLVHLPTSFQLDICPPLGPLTTMRSRYHPPHTR